MKLTLTHTEASKLILAKLGLYDHDVQVEIVADQPTTSSYKFDPFSAIGQIVREIDSLTANGNIIGAIKVYRTHAICGLKEAKDIVEDWTNQRAKVIATGILHKNLND